MSPDQVPTHLAPILDRVAGVSIPVFSLKTEENFGIGEILDLIPLIDWAADHHLRLIQLLPLGETAPGESSPYQSLSGFAMDPIYLSVLDLPDFRGNDRAERLFNDPSVQQDLSRWRSSERIERGQIRLLKHRLLDLCFERYYREEWLRETPRAQALKVFVASKAWMEDYALFRLLKERFEWHYWLEWPPNFRDRDPRALRELRQKEEKRLLKLKYFQWLIFEQWRIVLKRAGERGMSLMGDLPFLISRDSSDVWSDRGSFSLEDSVGAPPDFFSAEGQNWGLPVFRWGVMEKNGLAWWRLRMREARDLFSLLRLDHVVGFFRIWIFPAGGSPRFEPEEEGEQIRRGTQLLNAILEEAGGCIPVAEDLGVIPKFVRQTLQSFRIAGNKVFRWEKDEQGKYYDPAGYPFVSLATTGTHDTSTLAGWWADLTPEERAAVWEVLRADGDPAPAPEKFSEFLNERVLDRLLLAGSMIVLFPFQDLFGLKDQINIPATIGPGNWSWRLQVDLKDLERLPFYAARSRWLRDKIDFCGRSGLTHRAGDR